MNPSTFTCPSCSADEPSWPVVLITHSQRFDMEAYTAGMIFSQISCRLASGSQMEMWGVPEGLVPVLERLPAGLAEHAIWVELTNVSGNSTDGTPMPDGQVRVTFRAVGPPDV